MSISHKTFNAQLFRLMVYRRALHPELFDLQTRRNHRHGEYEVETWIIPAGHICRFQANGHTLAECVIEEADHLPETGLIHALPCLGEKDYELTADEDKTGINYVTTLQTESLTDNLYSSTLQEMRDFASEVEAISYEWTDEDGTPNMSLLDVQKYKHEFHFQSYHLIGCSASVLRTQSIFEIA